MQRPRHSGYSTRLNYLWLALLVAALVLPGCRDDEPDSPVYGPGGQVRQLDAAGERVLLVGPEAEPVVKLRKRTDRYKVYGPKLAPLGYVRWEEDAAEADGDARALVSVRPIDGANPASIRRSAPGTYELANRLRIERTGQGWAVSEADGDFAGVFELRDDQTWALRRDRNDEAFWTAERVDGKWSVRKDGETTITTQVGELSGLEVLAFQLEDLDVLERAAVAAWMVHARPDSEQ